MTSSHLYSTTWRTHTAFSRVLSPAVTADNVHLSAAFSGLYDKPSPFPDHEHGRLDAGHSLFGFFRHWFVILRQAYRFRLQFQAIRKHPLFPAIVPYMSLLDPGKNPRGLAPLYVVFEGKKFNGSFLKAAEQLSVIEVVVPREQFRFICEIGAGFGAMAEIVIKRHRPQLYCIIDLPETLQISSLYLRSVFPGSVQCPSVGEEICLTPGPTIVLLKSSLAERLKEFAPTIGLFLNSNSFSEMPFDVLTRYFALIETYTGTYLSNVNPPRFEGEHLYAGPETYPYSKDWEFVRKQRQQLPYYCNNYQMISYLPMRPADSSVDFSAIGAREAASPLL